MKTEKNAFNFSLTQGNINASHQNLQRSFVKYDRNPIIPASSFYLHLMRSY